MNLKRYLSTLNTLTKNNIERIGLQLKYVSSPFIKKSKFKEPPNKEWKSALKQMREEGFAEIPSLLSKEEINNIESIDNNLLLDHFNKGLIPGIKPWANTKSMEYGYGAATYDVDNLSPLLQKPSFWSSLEWLTECYLGSSHFWVRNLPVLRYDSKKHRKTLHRQKFFHLDHGTRQLSMILLLNPTSDKSTCTEIIPKTNKSPRFGYELSPRDNPKFIDHAKREKKKNGSIKIFGKVGSTYLFDAGNTLHRGNYGEDRLMLHFNFACSYRHDFIPGQNQSNEHENSNFIGKKPKNLFLKSPSK